MIARTALLLLVAASAGGMPAAAQTSPVMSTGPRFEERDGAALYAHVCAACHQADGRGAVGAGTYPSLARNTNLAAAGYPVLVVLQGLRAMPPLGRLMSDAQVVDVVTYIRTHFGNDYGDAISEDEVKVAR